MGEIADAMIGGEMCNHCGVYLDGTPSGFPSFCSKSCAKAIMGDDAKDAYIPGEIDV